MMAEHFSDNVVPLLLGATKADAYIDNVTAPKPSEGQLGEAMKRRIQDALLPIQEAQRREFVLAQLGVMDALLNDALHHFAYPSIATARIESFQEELSYTMLSVIVPGGIEYSKAVLKLAQVNAKAVGAFNLFEDEECSLERYRKARKLLAEATITLGQVSGCIGYVDERTIQGDY